MIPYLWNYLKHTLLSFKSHQGQLSTYLQRPLSHSGPAASLLLHHPVLLQQVTNIQDYISNTVIENMFSMIICITQ